MLTALLRSRFGQALVDRLIARAMRTPYFHLFHDDGAPYMERYWLVRIGMPRNWRALKDSADHFDYMASRCRVAGQNRTAESFEATAREYRLKLVPRFGIRLHRIQSSDVPAFHDHPWDYTTLILRNGYREVRPDWSHGPTPAHVTVSDDYDGHPPTAYLHTLEQYHGPGSLLRRRAGDWHYLQLRAGEEAWTMFFTGRKRQGWGFLADGLIKVPWRTYLTQRRSYQAAQRARAEGFTL